MTEKRAYADWILSRCPTSISALGSCSSATLAMAAAFPELKRVRGHVNGVEHWWMWRAWIQDEWVAEGGGGVGPADAMKRACEWGALNVERFPFEYASHLAGSDNSTKGGE